MSDMIDVFFDARLADLQMKEAALAGGAASLPADSPEVKFFVEAVESAEERVNRTLKLLEQMEFGVAGVASVTDARTGAQAAANLLAKPLSTPGVGDVAKNHVRVAIGGIETALVGISSLDIKLGSAAQTASVGPIRSTIAKLLQDVPHEHAPTRAALMDSSMELEQLSGGSATNKTLGRAFDGLERAASSLISSDIETSTRDELVGRISRVQADVSMVSPSPVFGATTAPVRQQLQEAQVALQHAKVEAARGDVYSAVDTIMDSLKTLVAKNAAVAAKV